MDHWRNQRLKKIPEDKWKWKHDDPKPMGNKKNSSKRKVYSDTSLPQTNNLTVYLKELGKKNKTEN